MRGKYFKTCKGCEKRSEGCHSKCEEYAKEVILGVILECDETKERATNSDVYGIYEAKVTRIANSCPSAARSIRKNRILRNRGR